MKKRLYGVSRSVVLAAALCAMTNWSVHRPAMAEPITHGVNHLGLTVKDLDASVAFFVETLGWHTAGGDPSYPSVFVTDGNLFLTLWRATDPDTAIAFNRKTNLGLHHLALTVSDLETLDELHETFKKDPTVTVEFAPEFLGDGPTTHMMVYEPSGLRIEFIVPNGVRRSDLGKTKN